MKGPLEPMVALLGLGGPFEGTPSNPRLSERRYREAVVRGGS